MNRMLKSVLLNVLTSSFTFAFVFAQPTHAQRGVSANRASVQAPQRQSAGKAQGNTAGKKNTNAEVRTRAQKKAASNVRVQTGTTATHASTQTKQVRVVVVNHYYNGWWGGGLYLGIWYGPGAFLPGFWYWNGWVGYQYEYEPYLSVSGIKFDLNQVSKADRKMVNDAGVYLPDENGQEGYLGKVGNFSGKLKRSLPLNPGTYNLTVALKDGRKLDMRVTVQPHRVTNVALDFDQPSQEQLSAAEQSAPSGQSSPAQQLQSTSSEQKKTTEKPVAWTDEL